LHFGQDMGGEDHPMLITQLPDEIAYFHDLIWIQSVGGFIQNDDGRFVDDGLCDADTLLVTLG